MTMNTIGSPLNMLTKRKSIRAGTGIGVTGRSDKMQDTVGSYLVNNLQREVNTSSLEQLKILSDFNVPIHKFNKLDTDEERTQFLLEHMVGYVKNLLK